MWDPVGPFNAGWGPRSVAANEPLNTTLDTSKTDGPLGRRSNCSRRKLLALETKLQQHMDCEDQRVKELTEAILYEFLPSALNALLPQCEDPIQQLDPDRCRAVAGAALAVSALLNAPPGFLEFLLCIPWKHLSQLHLRFDGITSLASMDHLHVAEEERMKLVNIRVAPALMAPLLDFIFREEYMDSLPPMLRPPVVSSTGTQKCGEDSTGGGGPCPGHTCCPHHAAEQAKQSGKLITPDTVAALLDGATPLHCAALRGNPAQVDHLLFCGADPLIRTAAGELAMELVPMCGDRHPLSGQRTCRCMATKDQEVWECRSRLARGLIMRKSLLNMSAGLLAWFNMLVLCVLCCLGLWGYHVVVLRPRIDQHKNKRAALKRDEESHKQAQLVAELRSTAMQGLQYLEVAKREMPISELVPQNKLQGGDNGYSINARTGAGSLRRAMAASGQPFNMDILAPDKAFRCFVRAVHAVQRLEAAAEEEDAETADNTLPLLTPNEMRPAIQEDEQAAVYCGWAESVLLKFRACACPGCSALTVQAIRMAHIQCARLFARVDRRKHEFLGVWKAVGQYLAKTVHTHICLLLETEAPASPTQAAVWRAQQCLKEWHRLREVGLTQELGPELLMQVELLHRWCRTAESDLLLTEALLGAPLKPSQSVQEGVAAALMYNAERIPFLTRPVQPGMAHMLRQALQDAACPSAPLKELATTVANNVGNELHVAAQLHDLVLAKGVTAPSTRAAADGLARVIEAAADFPHLGAEVQAARVLMERWQKRAEAVEQLDNVMEYVRDQSAQCLNIPALKALLDVNTISKSTQSIAQAAVASASAAEGIATVFGVARWDGYTKQLESAIEEAKDVNISVTKARRLLKEMQAHCSAVEAVRNLEAVMGRKPCGSAALKGAVAKAETASTSLAALGLVGPTASLQELLLPRLQVAKRRLEGEKAAEALAKVASSCKSVSDLQKLEGAILGARKVGAEELDIDAYRAASELRARLAEAAKVKGTLESSIKALQKQGRGEDAEMVHKALVDAARWDDLLATEAAKAAEALEAWKVHTASEAKLSRVLREGAGTALLGRAIQEAAAAGVKVQAARRVLKLMQLLENAMTAVQEQPSTHATLKARLDAAEAGGVTSALLDEARKLLRKLQVVEAREALEAALKPHSDWSVMQRSAALKSALDAAEEVLVDVWPAEKEKQAASGEGHPATGATGGGGKAAGRGGTTPSVSDGSGDADFEAGSEVGESTGPTPSIDDARHRMSDGLHEFAADADVPMSPNTSVPAANTAHAWAHKAPLQIDDAASEAESTTSSVPTSSAHSFTTPRARVGICRVNLQALLANKELLGEDMSVLVELSSRAQKLLEEEHRELERLEREKFEQDRARKEQLERERFERERLRAEREREKAEREKTDSIKARKLAAERAEQQKMLLQQVQVLPASEQHRLARERMPRRRPRDVLPAKPVTNVACISTSGSSNSSLQQTGSASGPATHETTSTAVPGPTDGGTAALHSPSSLPQPWAQAAKGAAAKGQAQAPPLSPVPSKAPLSPSPSTADPYSPHRPLKKSEVEEAVRRTHHSSHHSRGDSMEGLTEAALSLNREMLELLEIDAKDPQTSKSFQVSPTPSRQPSLSFSPFASPSLMASVLPQAPLAAAQSAAVAAGFTSSTTGVCSSFPNTSHTSKDTYPTYNNVQLAHDLGSVFSGAQNAALVQAVSAVDANIQGGLVSNLTSSALSTPGLTLGTAGRGPGGIGGGNTLEQIFSADAALGQDVASGRIRTSFGDAKGLLSSHASLFEEQSGGGSIGVGLGSRGMHGYKASRRLDLSASAWSMELPKTSGSFTAAATSSLQLPGGENNNIWGPPTSAPAASTTGAERPYSTVGNTGVSTESVLSSSNSALNQLWNTPALCAPGALNPAACLTNQPALGVSAAALSSTAAGLSGAPGSSIGGLSAQSMLSINVMGSASGFNLPSSSSPAPSLLSDPVWACKMPPSSSSAAPASPKPWANDLTTPVLSESFSPDLPCHSKGAPPTSLSFISHSVELGPTQLSSVMGLSHSTSSLSHTAAALVDWPLTLRGNVLMGGPGGVNPRSASRVCRYFLQGYCRDGDMCRFVHPSGTMATGMSGSAGLSGSQATSMGPSASSQASLSQDKTGQLAAMLMAVKAQQQQHVLSTGMNPSTDTSYQYPSSATNTPTAAYYPPDDTLNSPNSRVLEPSNPHKVNAPPLRINPAHLVNVPGTLLSPNRNLSGHLGLASSMHRNAQLMQNPTQGQTLSMFTSQSPSPMSQLTLPNGTYPSGGAAATASMQGVLGGGMASSSAMIKQPEATLGLGTGVSGISFQDMLHPTHGVMAQYRMKGPGLSSLGSMDSPYSSMDGLVSPNAGMLNASVQGLGLTRSGILAQSAGLNGGLGGSGAYMTDAMPYPGMDLKSLPAVSLMLQGAVSGGNNFFNLGQSAVTSSPAAGYGMGAGHGAGMGSRGLPVSLLQRGASDLDASNMNSPGPSRSRSEELNVLLGLPAGAGGEEDFSFPASMVGHALSADADSNAPSTVHTQHREDRSLLMESTQPDGADAMQSDTHEGGSAGRRLADLQLPDQLLELGPMTSMDDDHISQGNSTQKGSSSDTAPWGGHAGVADSARSSSGAVAATQEAQPAVTLSRTTTLRADAPVFSSTTSSSSS